MSPFKIVRKLGEVFFEGDIEPPSGDAAIAADACNAAAEHFDDPAVAEEMDRLLEENPDNLDEIVENDEALRNLRDSDPIAAELMRDPETFKVITDGDNLRGQFFGLRTREKPGRKRPRQHIVCSSVACLVESQPKRRSGSNPCAPSALFRLAYRDLARHQRVRCSSVALRVNSQ